jgi:hypothetical protein
MSWRAWTRSSSRSVPEKPLEESPRLSAKLSAAALIINTQVFLRMSSSL